ncbi:MAG: TonB-dependent receptor [Novosphingobium sp.]|nr:TonB-dependent receptor [Novosphingobium sp.]
MSDADGQGEDITVVATGSVSPIEDSGQSLSVITAGEIDSVQGPDLTRVLERAPGVTLSRNGGLGSFTGVRVRGSASDQVLVLVDGVRVADTAAPGGGFDFGTVLSGEIGRIELLRGSNSVIWGSDALGGVLALTTRAPAGLEANAEHGARDSFAGQAGWGVAVSDYTVRIGGGYARGDGVSAAASGSESDGFRQWNLRGAGEAPLTASLSVLATARYADSRVEIDGFPPPSFAFADTAEFQDTRQLSGRAGLRWASARVTVDAGYAHSDTRRDLVDPALGDAPYFTTRGRSGRAELLGRWELAQAWRLDFGADRQRDRFSTGPSFGSRGRATLTSGHALLGWHRDAFDFAGGVRFDHHSTFGGEWSLGANGSIRLDDDGWRLRASYGEGYKAPTLFQLLSDFGNPALSPERSRSYDIGIERGNRNAPLHLALTAFRRDSRDLIDFVSCFGSTAGICAGRPFGTYDNVGRARAEGIELELGASLGERFRAQAAYSHIRVRSRDSGNDLARRPRHALTLAADWTTPWAGLAVGGDLRLVSDSFDDAGNFVPIDGHALATLRASVPLGETLELYARIENLADVRHETAAGYGSAGRSAYAGARVRF